jgi:hypothetical protein
MTFLTVPDAVPVRYESREVAQRGGSMRQLSSPSARSTCSSVRTDVASRGGPRIDSDDDTSLETEGQSGSSVVDLDPARGIRSVVRVQLKERGGL